MFKAFYQSDGYEALRDHRVPRSPPNANITFSATHPAARDGILGYFNERSIERVGVLHGEYLLNEGGQLLVDRQGAMIAASVSLESLAVTHFLAKDFARPELQEHVRTMLGMWDEIPMAHGLPLLTDPYSSNYYHFSLELMPRLRYFSGADQGTFIMTRQSLSRPFQRDLGKRVFSDRKFLALNGSIRVRDPVLAHDSMSEEGISWLREASQISAQPGKRRLYLRRGATGTRAYPGGGLSHSPPFETLLRDFGFETIDFGNGELGVAEQIAMLEGAGVILAAHGAALTNLAYLNRNLTVVEVFGPRTWSGCFIHVAATLGFEYRGLFSDVHDERSDIVVDLDELNDILHEVSG